jgi:hypothetical protein
MIRLFKGFRLLTGFRGSPPMDVGALAKIVSPVSSFAYDYGSSVREIDVNPVILRADRAMAVDVLIVSKPILLSPAKRISMGCATSLIGHKPTSHLDPTLCGAIEPASIKSLFVKRAGELVTSWTSVGNLEPGTTMV